MELDMTKGNPTRLIVKFIIPIVIGNIFQQLYNMVDTIIVGRYVGVEALAAVGATGTISFLILGFLMGMTAGFTVLTAQRFGAGDVEGVKQTVGNAATLSVIITVVMTAFSVFIMDGLLKLMNTPEDIFDMAKTYIVIICLGMGCSVLYNLLSSFLRAVGNSKVPLYFLVVSAALNIILDLVLVLVIPMGVAGAAIATVVSQGISGVLCLIYIIKKVPVLKIEKRHWKLDGQCAHNQISIGLPMALQFSITAVGTILVQMALNMLGSTVVAAYTAACKVEQLVTQPYSALGLTMSTYCAQNRGVNDIKRIRKGVRISNVMSLIYSIVIYGIVMMALPYIIRLFVSGDVTEILEYARIYVGVCGLCFTGLGMIFIFRNAMQGCGFSFMPMMGGVVELLCRAVAAFGAAKYQSYLGVCMGNASSWMVTGIFLAIAYLFMMRKLLVLQKQPLEQ
ncbi:MAG: MATE family efflux transporter [Lachnospiraceae bacterium]|nr:MATE family efflux transporter [Lachnospiraceae bacterium]